MARSQLLAAWTLAVEDRLVVGLPDKLAVNAERDIPEALALDRVGLLQRIAAVGALVLDIERLLLGRLGAAHFAPWTRAPQSSSPVARLTRVTLVEVPSHLIAARPSGTG